MVSTITSRPNHYEVLGLTPQATDEDIARAFAREAGPYRPRPLEELARISLAYETLRNPAKRRAYDASLAPDPKPEPVPALWPRDGWPFVPTVRARPAGQSAVGGPQSPPRRADPQSPPKPAIEPRTEPFIAAPRSELVRPDAPRSEPVLLAPETRPATPAPSAQAAGDGEPDYRLDERFRDVESSPIDWRRPALAAGGLFLGVALLGAWLGLRSGNESQDVLPPEAVTLKVPEAEPAAPAIASPPPAAPSEAEPAPDRPAMAEAAPARIAQPSPIAPEPDVQEEQQAEAMPAEQGRIADIAAGLEVAEAPTAEATAATLPLPDSVVARTIRRIGYSCGEVASSSAVAGAAPGTFKVTCTSGDSYRAAPIRGRYHFRRWGRD